MTRVYFCLLAEADIIIAHDYIATGNPDAALKWVESTHELCQTIANHPRLGRLRDEIGPEIRSFVSGSYVVLYRIEEYGISISRIVHGSRDLSRIILDR